MILLYWTPKSIISITKHHIASDYIMIYDMIVQCLTWCYAILCWVMLHCVLYYAALHDIMLFFAVRFFTFCLLQKDVSFYFEDVNPVEMCVDSYYRFMLFLVSFHLVSYHVVSYNSSDRKNVCQCIHSNTLSFYLFLYCAMPCCVLIMYQTIVEFQNIYDATWCSLMHFDTAFDTVTCFPILRRYVIYDILSTYMWCMMFDVWYMEKIAFRYMAYNIDMAWHMIWHLFIYLLFSHDGSMHALHMPN